MSNSPKIPKYELNETEQISNLVQQGSTFHKQGDFVEAKKIYEKILIIKSDHFDALQLLGILLAQTNNYLEAIELFSKALKINPNHAGTFSNLGIALKELKRHEEALASFDEAIKLKPDYGDALNNRGNILHLLKRHDEAIVSFDKAIAINPGYEGAYYNRGNTLNSLKRFEEALASFDKAIAINPNYGMAYKSRGNTLTELKFYEDALASFDKAIIYNPDSADIFFNRGNIFIELKRFEEALKSFDQAITFRKNYSDAFSNRGIALKELNRPEDALASYDQAIILDPKYATAFFNRGNILQFIKRFDEAIISYDKAIAIDPNYVLAYYNRGGILLELKRYEEALVSFDQAITINPNHEDSFSNRGIVLRELKLIDDAIKSYDKAIEINPNHVEANWNSAHCNLLKGNFDTGWQLYEWRWLNSSFESKPIKTKKPPWDYKKNNKRLLVWEEQGIGDQVLFGSLLLELKKIMPNLTVKIDKRLMPIFKRSIPEIKFYPHDFDVPESEYDIHVPIGSLGKYLRNSKKDFSKTKDAFLFSDKINTQKIRNDLSYPKKLICGVSWRSKNIKTGAERSIPLEMLATIFDSQKISLVNLQYGNIDKDINLLKSNSNIELIQYEAIDNYSDLDSFTSLIDACDFVVSIDNSTIHISGALGKKTFVLLPYVNDWKWLERCNDNLWYPSLKLYRQDKRSQWDAILEKLKTELSDFIN